MLYPTPRVLTGSVFACSPLVATHTQLTYHLTCAIPASSFSMCSTRQAEPIVSWAVGQPPPVTVCLRALSGGMPASGSTCPFAACPWLRYVYPFIAPFTRVPRPWVTALLVKKRQHKRPDPIGTLQYCVVIVPSAHKQTRAHLSHSSTLDECDQCETRPCLSWLHSHTVDLQHSKHGRSTHHTHSTHTHNTHIHRRCHDCKRPSTPRLDGMRCPPFL